MTPEQWGALPYLHEVIKSSPASLHIGHWLEASRISKQIRCMSRSTDLFSFPGYISKFVRENNFVAANLITFGKMVVGYNFRALASKEFTVWQESHGFYFASSFGEGFRYGLPIFVVEGVVDAELVGKCYPYVVGCLHATVSVAQAQLLSILTGRVVFVPDRDAAGERGYKVSKRELERYGVKVGRIDLPEGIKDAGELYYHPRLFEQFEFEVSIGGGNVGAGVSPQRVKGDIRSRFSKDRSRYGNG